MANALSPQPHLTEEDAAAGRPLRQLAGLFLKLGTIGFGGPAAHIALMHEEVVRKRRWMTDAEFADMLAATNLIPGPNSTEMAIHVGRRAAGWPGLVVAGSCFILPAAIIVGALAWMYQRYGSTPDARSLLHDMAPVVVAIVAVAVWRLSRTTLKTAKAWIVAVASAGLAASGMNELLLLGAAGAAMMIGVRKPSGRAAIVAAAVAAATAGTAAAVAADAPAVPLGALTFFFVKVGSVLYGSGYVLFAFLRADLVERWHWLTDRQLLDAIAVGQVTPGPLFTTATFIGYVLAGWRGAVLATLGIFLPAFVFVAVSQPLIPHLRRSRMASAFLDGVVAASLGLMAAVCLALARAALVDVTSVMLAAASGAALVLFNVNGAWLLTAGAVIGLLRGR